VVRLISSPDIGAPGAKTATERAQIQAQAGKGARLNVRLKAQADVIGEQFKRSVPPTGQQANALMVVQQSLRFHVL
jgi:hypothetical protein